MEILYKKNKNKFGYQDVSEMREIALPIVINKEISKNKRQLLKIVLNINFAKNTQTLSSLLW